MPARQGGVNLLQMVQMLLLPARGLVIAERLRFAASIGQRTRGLLGTDRLEPGSGLAIATRQVHTFGMGYVIDVVFCTSEWRVVHVVHAMRPNRVSRLVLRSRWAIELPEGAARQVQPGDVLALEPVAG